MIAQVAKASEVFFEECCPVWREPTAFFTDNICIVMTVWSTKIIPRDLYLRSKELPLSNDLFWTARGMFDSDLWENWTRNETFVKETFKWISFLLCFWGWVRIGRNISSSFAQNSLVWRLCCAWHGIHRTVAMSALIAFWTYFVQRFGSLNYSGVQTLDATGRTDDWRISASSCV